MTLDFMPVFVRSNTLLLGAVETAWLGIAGMVGALVIGVLCASTLTFAPRVFARMVAGFVYFFRSTPLLSQIIAAYYAPALVGIDLPPSIVGILCLSLYFGAYVTEILRAGIDAIPSGQVDAARALGMKSSNAFIQIVLPQIFAVVIPPLTGQFVNLVKATSLLSVISIQELTLRGRFIIIQTIAPLETYIVIAAIYLVMNAAIIAISRRLEAYFRRYL
jgi:polar amino acid transport system permease protein